MNTSRLPGRALVRFAFLAALAVSGLAACGGEDEPASTSRPSSSEADLDAGDALDALGDDGLVDTLGKALVISLPGASGYSVDGEVVTVELDAESGETSASLCAIANAARDGVAAPAEIELAFTDATVDCHR